ncbi:formimidoylglutamase [Arsenicicoccus piscis]|uniref:Formimidoylglutamase n=1 Tax=Arsenicicoccus piscis TaxID=673954 RepID=A0ABQ6HML3_9MICO|nr:formimidoylglutamase [Arsenicicoccus piscis]MCH8629062.1 formimidoylglutamase [Arsenicicoccus piscis]GMA19691.1 formimidoylglutamase [Arsenicicoccus piscis]
MTDAPRVVATPAGVWSGRDDGPGAEHRRWHHLVSDDDAPGGVALVGFASDEGVRRNHGRPGAAQGPDALRGALASMAVHPGAPRVVDAGTVVVAGEDLEAAQDALGEQVGRLLDAHDLVVVLGGGHESAWGSYLGRTAAQRLRGRRVGVLNLDAHFDLRRAGRPTSGTPFRQMADADAAAGRPFAYTVLGIAEPSNTEVLFVDARELGVRWLTDEQCTPRRLAAVLSEVDALLARVDVVHLSIDLDVLPAAVAPGVSAPAGLGVPLETVHEVCRHVAASGQLVLVDVVELLPRFDVDGRTARTAARLIDTIVRAAAAAPSTQDLTHQEDS